MHTKEQNTTNQTSAKSRSTIGDVLNTETIAQKLPKGYVPDERLPIYLYSLLQQCYIAKHTARTYFLPFPSFSMSDSD